MVVINAGFYLHGFTQIPSVPAPQLMNRCLASPTSLQGADAFKTRIFLPLKKPQAGEYVCVHPGASQKGAGRTFLQLSPMLTVSSSSYRWRKLT